MYFKSGLVYVYNWQVGQQLIDIDTIQTTSNEQANQTDHMWTIAIGLVWFYGA
jgi:hypothetical protein